MTIHEFAKKVGVSTATIWRAINGRGGISEETRERVLSQMRELGYYPNRAAQALAGGRTNLVALWMPNLFQPVYGKVMQNMQQQAGGDDYDLLVRDLGYHRTHGNDLSRLTQGRMDGVVVFDGGAWLKEALRNEERPGIPLVSIGAYYVDSVDHVGVDLAPAAREAVEHLIARGSRRMACMLGQAYLEVESDARRDAYTAVVREADVAPEYIAVGERARRSDAEEALLRYVERHGAPGGIFCYNDEYAIGALRGLKRLGLRVPEDVALVGCDGIEDTEYMDPPLSTIAQPVEEMCATAWQFLRRRMQEPESPLQGEVLRPSLEVRESSR